MINNDAAVLLEDFRKLVDSHRWFHSIDLGDGIITSGTKSQATLSKESAIVFSNLNVDRCSVMDVGAWNGFFTTEAVRYVAKKVLAVDPYTWLHPKLRGKETFDLVMSRRGMHTRVNTQVTDVMEISEQSVGQSDVVLFLGVFYHLVDPIIALQKLAAITKEVLVLETYLDRTNTKLPAMVFFPGKELDGDPTNWWGQNCACVEELASKH